MNEIIILFSPMHNHEFEIGAVATQPVISIDFFNVKHDKNREKMD